MNDDNRNHEDQRPSDAQVIQQLLADKATLSMLVSANRLRAESAEERLADAWDEGHKTRWRRGPDNCQCSAWSSGECACGEYGNGELLSLADNPFRGEVSA